MFHVIIYCVRLRFTTIILLEDTGRKIVASGRQEMFMQGFGQKIISEPFPPKLSSNKASIILAYCHTMMIVT
jgi:hypothetical protein